MSKYITLAISEEKYEMAKKQATIEDIKVNDIIRKSVEGYILKVNPSLYRDYKDKLKRKV